MGLESADRVFDEATERAIMTMMRGGLKRISAASYAAAVSSFGNWLHAKRIRAAPYKKIKIRVPKMEPDFLERDEYLAMLRTPVCGLNLRRAQVAVNVFLDTGIRTAELLGLTPTDLSEQFIRVCGKGMKQRFAPWLPATRAKVLEFAAEYPGEFIFHTATGRKMGARNLLRDVKALAKKAGIKRRVFLHLLRHTLGSWYLADGGNVKALQAIMGHSSLSVTNRYAGASNTMVRLDHAKASPLANL